ncbi:MAG: YMGG-like glycine zipper-containing protein [Planctomycetota bacterium]
MPRIVVVLVFGAALVFAMGGCRQGPGHTRALGTVVGTAAGAALGAAVSPCYPGSGALVGAGLGMVAGSIVGEGIAQDQEARGMAPRVMRSPCSGCRPRPVPRRTVIRRYTVVEQPTATPGRVVYEEVPTEVEVIEEDGGGADYGYRGE